MPAPIQPTRIGIYGTEETEPASRGVGLWAAGLVGSLTYAGAEPVLIEPEAERDWEELFADVQGVVFCGFPINSSRDLADQESMCLWCHNRRLPMLAIDRGLLIMNGAFGGNSFEDLPRELPDALQHRHRPEKGVRHAINVEPKTNLADVYGEGEIIVNSEHTQAINTVASGFFPSARALDGVIEGIEWNKDDWFAVGVQWQPASASASGLDIQLFRAFVEGCVKVASRHATRHLAAVA
jgi:gamma-glutamyl-gamma-aminobutyrate hydrolase PuuD